ncbi:pseudaminic acid biosynthesis-associated methylase [Clostridium sp.]|uniref:pseudaminic acid biosynthesis-associated methylase n=1 Tax=Clostridium sp. TaxID=1506 RepID=UPI002844615A|nr:pseudaminic acid biosynthesis-associated methylase [Clostridium sp.]MDR3598765.1 hypothetical protein [Clostridium sp.]
MKQYKTEQEKFWAGEFGTNYIERNYDKKILAGNIYLFSQIVQYTLNVKSVIEFGSNIGLNLLALKQLLPDASYTAVEINKNACDILAENKWICVKNESILDYKSEEKFDFVLSKGVMIHLNPNELDGFYNKIYKSSGRYICIAEYFNPSPVEIPYRGFLDRLFKRDFAGEMLKKFADLKLVKYGFSYHLDNNFPQDDINWFLLEKDNR